MKGQILAQNLSKSYFSYGKEIKRILSWIGFPFKPVQQIEVLKNISFIINPGESVAIVGQNGAGKSTLLKILTGTTAATSGTFETKGKIAAILELGMGFNTEFTGRENAFHAATLMGYTKEEIDSVMLQIKEFSEIGDYFDQPMRTYSSGMQMRVAFAVATAHRPDFLIIDEALAVGDTYFQHKSYTKIREFKALGTTILFVSHDRNAIINICERSFLIDKGRLLFDGPTGEALDLYNALLADKEQKNISTEKQPLSSGQTITKSGTGEVSIKKVSLFNKMNQSIENVEIGQQVTIRIDVEANVEVDNLVAGYSIRDKYGQIMFGTNSNLLGKNIGKMKALEQKSLNFSFVSNLGIGIYYITLALHAGENHLKNNYDWIDNCCNFEVINKGQKFQGCVYLQNEMEVPKSK